MLHDPAVRRSLDRYIRSRIQEIPSEIRQAFPGASRVWKCGSEEDFIYGYYVGRIEEGALRYLFKATRSSSGGHADAFDIREMIEMHRGELQEAIRSASGQ